jgi:hypothetical protein
VDDPIAPPSAAAEILPNRSNGRHIPIEQPRSRSWLLPWVLVLALAAFSLGLIANPWFEEKVRARLPGLADVEEVAEGGALDARISDQQEAVDALERRVASLEARPATGAGTPPALNDVPLTGLVGTAGVGASPGSAQVDARVEELRQVQERQRERLETVAAAVDTLEGRLSSTLDLARSGSERAHELLLLNAARRSLELGRPLGQLESSLRQAFGERYPALLGSISHLSGQGLTRRSLAASFEKAAPAITEAAEQRSAESGVWQDMKRAIGSVVRVRRVGSAAHPASGELIQQVKSALNRGDVERAVALVSRLPADARAAASGWLEPATSFTAGIRALDQLESAVLAGATDSDGGPSASAAPARPAGSSAISGGAPASGAVGENPAAGPAAGAATSTDAL